MIGVQRPFGRNGSMATLGAGGREDEKPGMGRATALLDMTKCFEQVRLWSVWRWGMPLGFPTSAAQDHPLGLQLSTACGTLGVGVVARDDSRSHHRRVGLFLRHPPHALHLALRLSDEQVSPTAADEVRGRFHRQLQRNEPNHTVSDGDHRGGEPQRCAGWRMGWTSTCRKTRKERRQVGGLGLKRCAYSGTGLFDEGARHEGGLARAYPGR